MAGAVDLSNPGIQQALRDTFSDPSLGRAVAQAIPSFGGDPQKAWDSFRWTWNSGRPVEQQLGAEWAQGFPLGAQNDSNMQQVWQHPFTQGVMGGLEDTNPGLFSWLKNRYKAPQGQVSAWV